ncbi:NupC/NupG family nucleoside CNT transporter [Tenacibaculum sp. UWU-22]|uniref:NupC/NupG family nucleoside CNT transporter n=1 Tax=Tenacibaculum sp. UWU-22 TaxID=3234187 RepID=UPI0034DAD879
MKKTIGFAFCLLLSIVTFSQNIEQQWCFSTIEKMDGTPVALKGKNNILELTDGQFKYTSDSLNYSGSYIRQNNLLLLKSSQPKDTVRYYNIVALTNNSLVLSENNLLYKFKIQKEGLTKAKVKNSVNQTTTKSSKIIPSQGFSIYSLWRGVLGMVVLLLLAFLFSANRKSIDWKTVILGLTFQVLIAIGVLKVPFVQRAFEWVGGLFVSVLDFSRAGSEFLFGGLVNNMDSFGFIFAFQVLPTIIFFSALTSLLFYLGIIQKVVKSLAWLLSKSLKISGAESLSVSGNIFLGQTEAPLLIKAYLEKMNRSEILLVMIGGMATVAGAVLAAYIGFLGGNDAALRLLYAKHLLAASVMAASGAIVISKILYPQTEKINTDVTVLSEKIGSNVLDAIANGTTDGLRLAMNVAAMLLVFIAFIAMLNGILDWFGELTSINTWMAQNTSYAKLSLEAILGYLFAPLMWLIGVAKQDIALMGQLLGVKLVASEFVAYIQLAELKNVASASHLLFNKSIIMATYMLCGFANFASIGIQIGGIGSLAPKQRKNLSEFGMKALIGGTIASLMSATIAGIIIG